ncbi:hypothetical protein D3C76_1572960 [compost metagenome]
MISPTTASIEVVLLTTLTSGEETGIIRTFESEVPVSRRPSGGVNEKVAEA